MKESTKPFDKTLGVVLESHGCRHEGAIYVNFSLGRVIDRLASRHHKLVLSLPLYEGAPDPHLDYRLQSPNIEVVPQPFFVHSVQAIRHAFGLAVAYWRTSKKSDWILLRGMFPYVMILYASIAFWGCRVCHWIVGDPVACLRGNRRRNLFMDGLSILYAWQDRLVSRLGRRVTGGIFLCNGEDLTRLYWSPRTRTTVSSTITDEEFFVRQDTCGGEKIRILYIGFVRPEKGLEYLIQAVAKLQLDKPWELLIVGRMKNYYDDYCQRLDRLIEHLGLTDRVRWMGYMPYGPEMFACYRQADMFVLPTLSEGTPRVLVEARANSVPIISTAVGGIPTSVRNGYDGLLVAPKDADALARAIEGIASDGEFRRNLIRNGLATARTRTVDRFVDTVEAVLEDRGLVSEYLPRRSSRLTADVPRLQPAMVSAQAPAAPPPVAKPRPRLGPWPTVSVVAPMYNEAAHIRRFADCMLAQDYPQDKLEILLVDGGSGDGTQQIAEQVARDHPQFRLLHNPDRFLPQGENLGIRSARGEYIARVDLHVGYGPDYIRSCIEGLQDNDAWCVGGVINTQPGAGTYAAGTIAIVQSHPFGVGNSYDRISTKARVVDTVAFPTLKREVFAKVGLYNELLPRHEDTDLYSRIRQAGGKLMVLPSIRTTYYSRPTLRGLLKQAWQNGYETALAWLVNSDCASARHWIPGLFVVSLILLGIGAFFQPMAGLLLGIEAGAYLLADIISAVHVGLTRGWRYAPSAAGMFILHHLAYGLATIAGTVELVRAYDRVTQYRLPTLGGEAASIAVAVPQALPAEAPAYPRPAYKKAYEPWSTIFITDPLAIPLTPLMARWKIHPNLITFLSLVAGLANGRFFAEGMWVWGVILFELSHLMDCLDGKVARLRGMSSDFGMKLDLLADWMRKPSAFLGIAIYFQSRGQELFVVLTAVSLVIHVAFHYIYDGLGISNYDLEFPHLTRSVLRRYVPRLLNLYNWFDEQFFEFVAFPLIAAAVGLPGGAVWFLYGMAFCTGIALVKMCVSLYHKRTGRYALIYQNWAETKGNLDKTPPA